MSSISTNDNFRDHSRGANGGAAAEGPGRQRSARRGSSRAAARETLLEVEILLQRLMYLVARPVDGDEGLTETARDLYELRRIRDRIFGEDLFADPSWDILLDLYIAQREGRSVTLSSACIASAAPTTTATRHVAHLVQKGLVVKRPHPSDARSSHLKLSAAGERKLTQLFRQMDRV